MKKSIALFFLVAMALISCSKVNKPSEDTPVNDTLVWDTVSNDKIVENDTVEKAFEDMDQFEINEYLCNESRKFDEEVEKDFQTIISLLPKYKDVLNTEKKKWEQYQAIVLEVGRCLDHGSSTPCYWSDVKNQGIQLRKESFQNLLYHLQGKEKGKVTKTRFTSAMIDEAYNVFIGAVNVNEDLYEYEDDSLLTVYRILLKNEQKCWNEWMAHRSKVSTQLPTNLRKIYDECTNQTKRTKLRQVKNQNEALGVTGHEPLDCILPEDCSDKALLEYPGFNVIWAHHIADLDWYPTFD